MPEELPHPDLAAAWRDARTPSPLRHVDAAACGRTSVAVRAAAARHAELEAELGGYRAEEAAAPTVDAARLALARLALGPGSGGARVAFVESALGALTTLLDTWPLPAGGRVLVGTGEYGPAVGLLAVRGFDVDVATPDQLPDAVRDRPPDLVHLSHVASYRGSSQPVAAVSAACAEVGVPLWLDAAQSLGQLDTAVGAAAVYGTSRKWLAGPRGVGWLAVAAPWRDAVRPWWLPAGRPAPLGVLDSPEGHVAGRVGLAVALTEHLAHGPERLRERLTALGALTRRVLDGTAGWSVADAPDDPSAIVGLAPPAGVDVAAVRAALIEHEAVLTTVSGPERAPLDPAATRTLLRVSGHVDTELADLEALAAALHRVTPRA